MIRSAFLSCALILAAVCFACAPGVPPPIKTAVATCSVGKPTFLDHVAFIQNGYTPNVNLDPPPNNIGTPIDPNSNYGQSLQNAFNLAPQSFQFRLCSLNGIYVNGPVSCSASADCMSNSWGYRVWHPDRPNETYIAISAGLWNLKCPDGSLYVYHCFETDLLSAVAGTNPQTFQYSSANAGADNFDMTILAALAHEVGHVQWYQAITPSHPGLSSYDPNSFCSSSFFSYSWHPAILRPPPWRVFLTREKRDNGLGAPDRHRYPPQDKEIDKAIDRGDLRSAAAFLEQLYQSNQPWASYFATISPDEDLVETYKFYILTNAQSVPSLGEGPLTSLPIVLAGVPHDIPGDYLAGNKPLLSSKTQCVAPVI
jgi:hypothetical protein